MVIEVVIPRKFTDIKYFDSPDTFHRFHKIINDFKSYKTAGSLINYFGKDVPNDFPPSVVAEDI